jgi:phosphoserine phosphatase
MTDESRWSGFDLIFFDCDSTLTAIEGINELARLKGKEWRVGVLTDKAMNGELELEEVYGKRLQAVRPTRGQLKEIEERYWQNIVPGAQAVIAALRYLGKQVFVISGGLAEPVRGFGVRLGVPLENIRAVELEYNQLSGDWWRYYEPETRHRQTYLDYDEGPLTASSGKSRIVQELAAGRPGRRLMVGDGSSDLAARSVVDLFVGFGGVVAREKVKAEADVFLQAPSLAPVLPLAVGPDSYAHLVGTPYQTLFDQGLALVKDGGLTIRQEYLRQTFQKAFKL